ncbi:MAG: hypothetical protein IPK19_17805 [Chloroflexi bacterium]|nr:hypothetical protein [Chloroflexota bacterium]
MSSTSTTPSTVPASPPTSGRPPSPFPAWASRPTNRLKPSGASWPTSITIPAPSTSQSPFSPERRRAYFDAIIQATERDILPTSRTYDAVAATGALVDQRTDGVDPATVERFGAAFGLARTLDRNLVEEVATSEISVVRHILYLRRMMLRYMKTLMMFLWTTLVTFIMLPFLQEERMPKFVIMSFAYLIWALLAMRVMRLPIGWIFRHLREIPDDGQIDKQLVILEEQVQPFIRVAIIAAAVAQVLSVLLLLTD